MTATNKPLDLAQFDGLTLWDANAIALLAECKRLQEVERLALILADASTKEVDRQREQIQALRDALQSVLPDLQYGTTGRWKGDGSATLVAALGVK